MVFVKVKKGDFVEWISTMRPRQTRINRVAKVGRTKVELIFPQGPRVKAAFGTLNRKFILRVVKR